MGKINIEELISSFDVEYEDNPNPIIFDLVTYIGLNKISNDYANKVDSLSLMQSRIFNSGFPSVGYSTNLFISKGKDKSQKDIQLLNDFLLELNLIQVSNYLLDSYKYFVEYSELTNYGDSSVDDYGDSSVDDFEDEYEKIDSLSYIYDKNEQKVSESLFNYCKDNLNKILEIK
ncbi:MAG: hypothetical protein GY828_05965 [Candidatus Gracilibacteria bacterium]|nr:hypothetical protein [Candidatus Gracilibacteria bacterium]